jgi:hypothetical protein
MRIYIKSLVRLIHNIKTTKFISEILINLLYIIILLLKNYEIMKTSPLEIVSEIFFPLIIIIFIMVWRYKNLLDKKKFRNISEINNSPLL